MKRKAMDSILELIEKEREGEQIGRLLLKNVLDIFMVVSSACPIWAPSAGCCLFSDVCDSQPLL